MNSLATYTLQYFVNKAANNNAVPSGILFRRYVKIGLIITPFVIWFIWAFQK
jgi:hypothetical protein